MSANLIIEETVTEEANMKLAEAIAEGLHHFYPGHLWAVTVQSGVADIRNIAVSGDMAYTLHLATIKGSAQDFKKAVMRAGGEYLERYGLTRGAAKSDELAGVKRDQFRRAVHHK